MNLPWRLYGESHCHPVIYISTLWSVFKSLCHDIRYLTDWSFECDICGQYNCQRILMTAKLSLRNCAMIYNQRSQTSIILLHHCKGISVAMMQPLGQGKISTELEWGRYLSHTNIYITWHSISTCIFNWPWMPDGQCKVTKQSLIPGSPNIWQKLWMQCDEHIHTKLNLIGPSEFEIKPVIFLCYSFSLTAHENLL